MQIRSMCRRSCFAVMLFTVHLFAQVPGDTLGTVDELRAPSSPAFTLLGVQPASIERPSTLRQFAVALGSLRPQDGMLPRDVAIEVSPFWLSPRPTLTFDEYYHPGLFQSIVQSFALSVASTPSRTPADSGTEVAIGFRTMVVPGSAHPRLAEVRDSLSKVQDEVLDEEDDDSPAQKVRFAALKRLALEIQRLDRQRQGWQVEIAGGASWSIPFDDLDRRRLSAAGLWITAGYLWSEPRVQLLAVARYLHQNLVAGDGDNADVGVRGIWTIGPLSVSGEWLHRAIVDIQTENTAGGGTMAILTFSSTSRYAASVDYRINDRLTLTATMGKDFAPIFPGTGDLLSALALQYDVSQVVEVLRK